MCAAVEFLLRLPSDHWNGKLVELGCGGPCGTLEHIQACDQPLRRGYACIISDGGHKADDSEPMKVAVTSTKRPSNFLLFSYVTAIAARRWIIMVQHRLVNPTLWAVRLVAYRLCGRRKSFRGTLME